jgi:hypothetical protein
MLRRGMISIEDATGLPGNQQGSSSREIESLRQWTGFVVRVESMRRSHVVIE